MPWPQLVVAFLEEYLQWRFGTVLVLALVLVTAGARTGSEGSLCAGGVLLVLVLLAWHA
ncbi:hypothetical protein [Streptomyces sp. H27-D2]|uniref:hypothetical protein n=1 Tax=Streptomyces sp. H27-D2 TaxID=3046304 RepID=UPI002DBD47CF|nr:hypothetical protein [Streptomyces sp. H27-D2]MEC4015682.1 hypothetical protein [Streptomyces sp. H27-D2]